MNKLEQRSRSAVPNESTNVHDERFKVRSIPILSFGIWKDWHRTDKVINRGQLIYADFSLLSEARNFLSIMTKRRLRNVLFSIFLLDDKSHWLRSVHIKPCLSTRSRWYSTRPNESRHVGHHLSVNKAIFLTDGGLHGGFSCGHLLYCKKKQHASGVAHKSHITTDMIVSKLNYSWHLTRWILWPAYSHGDHRAVCLTMVVSILMTRSAMRTSPKHIPTWLATISCTHQLLISINPNPIITAT